MIAPQTSAPEQSFIPQIRIGLGPVLVGMALMGALIGTVGGTPQLISLSLPVALTLMGMAGVGWLLTLWRANVGKIAVTVGLICVIILVRFVWALPGSLALLAIPIVLTSALLGNRWGAINAGVVSALLLGMVRGRLGGNGRRNGSPGGPMDVLCDFLACLAYSARSH